VCVCVCVHGVEELMRSVEERVCLCVQRARRVGEKRPACKGW